MNKECEVRHYIAANLKTLNQVTLGIYCTQLNLKIEIVPIGTFNCNENFKMYNFLNVIYCG